MSIKSLGAAALSILRLTAGVAAVPLLLCCVLLAFPELLPLRAADAFDGALICFALASRLLALGVPAALAADIAEHRRGL